MATRKVGWIELTLYPFRFSSNLVQINGNTIISAPSVTWNTPAGQEGDGIYSYNADKDDWDLYFKYPKDFDSSSHTLSYNENKNELYLFGFQARLIKFDINNKECKIEDSLTEGGYGSYPSTFFIDNRYHIIAGLQDCCHVIYDEDTNTFKSIHTFPSALVTKPTVIYSPSRNVIILFDTDEQQIYTYNTKTNINQWIASYAEFPCNLSEFDCALTMDERFVIMFGGYIDAYQQSNKILVMDLDKMKISESKILCPCESSFRCVIIDDFDTQYSLLVSGYIRLYGMTHIPSEMFKVIEKFCVRDYVHLIEKVTGQHWRMCVDEILFNML